ncbi:hypothetical protein EDB19DRAFT_1600617, partial [Suillus lakei]
LTFRFRDLPAELALLILQHAAQPSFSQTATYESKNPYSFALSLCLISKQVRTAVLPEILHTVLLPKLRNVIAFLDALCMQQAYALQNHQFKFDYAKCVRRMWMGQFRGSLPEFSPSGHELVLPQMDLSPLAPILLAAPSIAVDFESLGLLSTCLFHAWKSRVDNHERTPALYSPKTLMVTGTQVMNGQWWPYTETVHGAAFLASISHVISATHTITENSRHLCCICRGESGLKTYKLPDWMARVPFNNLQTASLPIPHSAHPVAECELSGKDLKVELLTFS